MDGEIGAGPRVPVTGIAEAVFSRALSVHRLSGPHTGLASGALGTGQATQGTHRGCSAGTVRLKDHRVRAGFQPDSGRVGGTRLGHHPGDLATIWRAAAAHHRAKFNRIKSAFDEDPTLPLIAAPYFRAAPWNRRSTVGGGSS